MCDWRCISGLSGGGDTCNCAGFTGRDALLCAVLL